MKFTEMHIGDALPNRAEDERALPAGWEGALEAGLPGSPTGRARAGAACMSGWSKGRPRR